MISFNVELKQIHEALESLKLKDKTRRAIVHVGQAVKAQTQQRIYHDKRAPDGQSWAPWSEKYAKTRHASQSLLVSSGRLNLSVSYSYGDDYVHVGTNQRYARAHQEGTKKIPRREFLGLSDDNQREVEDIILNNLKRMVSRD